MELATPASRRAGKYTAPNKHYTEYQKKRNNKGTSQHSEWHRTNNKQKILRTCGVMYAVRWYCYILPFLFQCATCGTSDPAVGVVGEIDPLVRVSIVPLDQGLAVGSRFDDGAIIPLVVVTLDSSSIPNSEPAFSHQNTAKYAGLKNFGIFFGCWLWISMHELHHRF